MRFESYKVNECFQHLYYQIPIELFSNPLYKDSLSSDAKILYALLLNRISLSAKNGWYDENKDIYIIFTRQKIQELLNLSDKTVSKAFKQLRYCGLIKERKRGLSKPNLIYVGKIIHYEETQNRKFSDSGGENIPITVPENLRTTKNNNTYNNRDNKPNNFFHSEIDYPEGYLDKYYINLQEQRLEE